MSNQEFIIRLMLVLFFAISRNLSMSQCYIAQIPHFATSLKFYRANEWEAIQAFT